jgi:hypothetical protein
MNKRTLVKILAFPKHFFQFFDFGFVHLAKFCSYKRDASPQMTRKMQRFMLLVSSHDDSVLLELHLQN